MAGFIGRILAYMLPAFLTWLKGEWDKHQAEQKRQADAKAKIEEENRKVREASENAQTPKEREDAVKNILDGY